MYERFVGFDGNSFYCKLCGKAGFKSPKAVIGHLNSCEAKSTSFGADYKSDSQEKHQQSTTTKTIKIRVLKLRELENRVNKLEQKIDNHFKHLIAENQKNISLNPMSFIFGLFIGIALGYFLARQSPSKIGDEIGRRVVNKAINKSVDLMMKKLWS